MIATRRTSPCKPTAREAIATAAGPAINFNTIPNMASFGPHAINFSCKAMNMPSLIKTQVQHILISMCLLYIWMYMYNYTYSNAQDRN